MKISCPRCRKEIPLEDVNISTDVALCRVCSQTFSFAELARDQSGPAVDLSRPPRGAWLRQRGGGFELGSTLRSASGFFLVPFTLLWSGGSLGAIYGSQIYKGQLDWKLSLIGLPFLVGSAFLISVSLASVLGKLVVRAEGDRGTVFIGVGPVGWTRRFRWSEVKVVRLSLARWQQNNQSVPLIELDREPKPIRFGSHLSEPRRGFVVGALKQLLAVRGH